MARQKTYYELLKDPQWQKKRLEIMQLSDFRCEQCDNDKETLNIHHTYYEKGLKPWEYPSESLICLCEPCHQKAQNLNVLLQRYIGLLGVGGDLEQLIGYAQGLVADSEHDTIIGVHGYEWAMGVGHVFGLNPSEVIQSLRESSIDGHTLDDLQHDKALKEYYRNHPE